MKLGFIILAHNEPETVSHLVSILAADNNQIVIHFDANSPTKQRELVSNLAIQYPGNVRVISKIHCKWGEWSLVEAVLLALQEFQSMANKPDFVHLMSAADFPIRSIADMRKFLQRNPGQDFIESHDITKKPWVKGGLSMERFEFFFPVNFRTSRQTFLLLTRIQRMIRMKRKIPFALTPCMGSQWWTLRWATCEKILDFIRQHPKVVRYFRSTWIPDESFFPTLVGHLIPRGEIANIQLLFHHFTPIGRPYIIYSDHVSIVRKLPHFFVRKVSPSARDSLWKAVQNRKSPIPRPKHLACVHALIAKEIDRNYEHASSTPNG